MINRYLIIKKIVIFLLFLFSLLTPILLINLNLFNNNVHNPNLLRLLLSIICFYSAFNLFRDLKKKENKPKMKV